MILGFIPTNPACAGKLGDRYHLPPHHHFLLLHGSLRQFSKTQSDGFGAKRKKKAFQTWGGLSWPQLGGKPSLGTSIKAFLSLPTHILQWITGALTAGPLTSPASVQWLTEVGLQYHCLPQTRLAKGRPGTVSTLKRWTVQCVSISIKLVLKRKKKMEWRASGRERKGEGKVGDREEKKRRQTSRDQGVGDA